MRSKKTNQANYFLKAYKNDCLIQSIRTKNLRRFSNKLAKLKNLECDNYFLSVKYGVIIDQFNKKTIARNQGNYKNKEDLSLALKAFLEVRC
jgi:hypothetical protein